MQVSVFRLFLLILPAIAVCSCTNAENKDLKSKDKQPKSDISFSNKAIDFGAVSQGSIIDTSFVFTNKSDVPLILFDVKASCGCTATDWNKNPIRPKGTDTIKVRFDSRHRQGMQKKFIAVFSNSKEYVSMLTLEGEVTAKRKTI